LDLSGFIGEKTNDMSCMFDGCKNLKVLNLKRFRTNKGVTMPLLFNKCESLQTLITNDKNILTMHLYI
jgi:hypothetical protein